MGKKSWFSAVRKVISTSYLKEKKHNKKSHNKSKSTKKSCHGNQMSLDRPSSPTKAPLSSPPIYHPPILEPEFKQPEHEPIQQDSIAIAMEEESANTTSQADAEVNCVTSVNTTFQAVAEVNCVTSAPHGNSREDIAAIKIQKAYRGYLVRNDSNPLKAWRRLKMYMHSQAVKRQGASTLMSMQTMARVQSQVRSRKIRMAEVNEALRQQLQQKRINKINNSKSSERSGFDLSPRSKEQVEASLQRKKEAAERREKVLAYSYTRQQTWRKNLQKTADSKCADWEWNWSAKWDSVRPWETGTYRDSVMTKPVRRQSPPSKVVAQSASSQSKVAALSTKTTKVRSPVSKPGAYTPMVSGKKRVQTTGALVGSAKKRVAVSGSPSSGVKKSPGSSRTITNTKR